MGKRREGNDNYIDSDRDDDNDFDNTSGNASRPPRPHSHDGSRFSPLLVLRLLRGAPPRRFCQPSSPPSPSLSPPSTRSLPLRFPSPLVS